MSNSEEQPTTEEQPAPEAEAVPKGLKPEQVIAITSLFSQILLNPDRLTDLLEDTQVTLRGAGIPDKEMKDVMRFLYELEKRVEAKLKEGLSHWAIV